ncbi:MAG: heavy metal-responsive transcriptional regulator [Chloroflexi bacterium]|nr:heavy metal-responsive transcriptional regulator [Chloroflexota bacterium]
MYQIKQLSQIAGVSPETIRHYERIGILPRANRAENGYRVYTEDDVKRLLFVGRARQLDFSLNNIAEILAFREDGTLPCAYVQDLIATKIVEIDSRIQELEMLRDDLVHLNQASQDFQPHISATTICQIIEANTDD